MLNKVYSATEIREKLASDDRWLVRGILAVYARQTADEKSSLTTKHHNGIGFNGRDAGILSSFARQILSWKAVENPRYPQPLSSKQLACARHKMLKYSAQLARIAEENNVDMQGYGSAADVKRSEVVEDAVMDEYDEAEAENRAERAAIMCVENYSELEAYDGELTW
jgi:hypothetical protein